MKAAVLVAPGVLELHDVPDDRPGPGEVVVAVRVALTDGTDLKAYRRGHPKMPMPTRFGHEFAGDVIATGAGVTNFAPGDRVVSVHSAPCLACYWCDLGEHELCATIMDRLMLGAYAETLRVPAQIAAFLEPLACVLHAWESIELHPRFSVAVHGVGGFGLLHALVARALGVENVCLIGRSAAALQRARELDAGRVLDATETDPRAAVLEATDGRGADLVIECTGAQEVWESAPALARRGGTVVLFGGLPSSSTVRFDAARLHYDEVRVLSPFHLTPRSVKRAFELLAGGRIDPSPLVTSTFALDDIASAFATLDAGRDLKIAVYPKGTV